MNAAASGVSIAAARLDDLPGIMGLEDAGFTPNEQWSERSWQGELLGDGRTTLLARRHVPVGVIALQTVGDVADLHRLVVSPRHRRQGVGAALVVAGLTAVRHAGARSVMLEVAVCEATSQTSPGTHESTLAPSSPRGTAGGERTSSCWMSWLI